MKLGGSSFPEVKLLAFWQLGSSRFLAMVVAECVMV